MSHVFFSVVRAVRTDEKEISLWGSHCYITAAMSP